jgi:hypothetical protein
MQNIIEMLYKAGAMVHAWPIILATQEVEPGLLEPGSSGPAWATLSLKCEKN